MKHRMRNLVKHKVEREGTEEKATVGGGIICKKKQALAQTSSREPLPE
jgi:hypothetical protein